MNSTERTTNWNLCPASGTSNFIPFPALPSIIAPSKTNMSGSIAKEFWILKRFITAKPNARAEWCRADGVQMQTGSDAWHPLQHDSSALRSLWLCLWFSPIRQCCEYVYRSWPNAEESDVRKHTLPVFRHIRWIKHEVCDGAVAHKRVHVVRKPGSEIQNGLDKLRVKMERPTTIAHYSTMIGKLRQISSSDRETKRP